MLRRPVSAALEQESSFQGHPLARHHLSTARCPFPAAMAQVSSYHAHPLALHHLRISRCPMEAAKKHVWPLHTQPFARAHLITSRFPPQAAKAMVSPFQLQPFALHHWRTSKHPPSAAAEHTCDSGGGGVLVCCLPYLTVDHASFSRRTTVPTPNRGTPTFGRLLYYLCRRQHFLRASFPSCLASCDHTIYRPLNRTSVSR